MDDRLGPRFSEALRTALLGEVRGDAASPAADPRTRPRRRPVWQPVLAFGVAAVTIVAIAIGLGVASQTRSSAPAVLPFGGDCAAILTSRQATGIVGAPLSLRPAPSPLDSAEALAVPAVGGLHCAWSGDRSGVDAVGVVLTVLPVAQRPEPSKADDRCYGENDGADLQHTCTVDTRSGGRWITGTVTGRTGGTETQSRAARTRLITVLRALPAAEASTPLDAAGWWAPVPCAALARSADLADALGRPGLTISDGNGDMVTPGQGAAIRRITAANCIGEADTDSETPFEVEVHAFRGAEAAVEAALADAGARRLDDVAGARVYRVDDAAGSPVLWAVTDGGALEVRPGDGRVAEVLPAVAPLLRVLDSTVRR
ncbi:hypothetical protein [Amnibacterium setariae]|uniref:Uncharacterized protein n=1 Tax=Amnibacterium setariae TaxID=2306585 RepID=A0A3A1U5B4_9MICO|nr:hypothetical protein [Amnibacterium setariae]RIX28144.1 hypothetical protein D1781_11725 [Amnibacterium setariae]